MITDALDCDLSISVTIEIDNQDLIDLGFITEDVTCGTNGSILINSISNLNGVSPYNIVISNPEQATNFTKQGSL